MTDMSDAGVTMQTDLAAVRGVVNSLLRQYIETAGRDAELISPILGSFWEQIGSVIQAGGKRLRPYLVVLAYEACGGQHRRAVMPVAAAWEMLHQALLIHDDIIDHDTWRHNQPNVAGLYRKTYELATGQPQVQAADATALLAGDILLAAAQQLILSSEVPLVLKPELTKLMSYAYQATCYGELLEVEAPFRPLIGVDALQVAEFKTAYYSVSGPLQSGAMLAGAPEELLDQLAELGRLLGIAYQLTDDLLGVFGDTELTGKSITSDLAEAKRTRLLQLAHLQLGEADQIRMETILEQTSIADSDVATLKQLIETSRATETLNLEIDNHVALAKQILERLPILDEPKERFTELIESLVERQT